MDWLKKFNEREQKLIANCMVYANDDPGGLPGHNLMLIVAKMAEMLSDDEIELEELHKIDGSLIDELDNPNFEGEHYE